MVITFQAMAKNNSIQIQNTTEKSVSSSKEEIIKEAKRIEESALYSAKGHYSAARVWESSHIFIGLLISILSGIVAAFIFSNDYRTFMGYLSLSIIVLSGIATFLNPNNRAGDHKTAGDKNYALNNRARVFWTIVCWEQGMTDELLTKTLKDLSEVRIKINSESPRIPKWAYLMAKRSIKAGEADFAVDQK